MRLDPITQGYYVMEYEATNRLRPTIDDHQWPQPDRFRLRPPGPDQPIILRGQTKEEENYSAKVGLGEEVHRRPAFACAESRRASIAPANRPSNASRSAIRSRRTRRPPKRSPFAQVTRIPGSDRSRCSRSCMPRYMEALPKEAQEDAGHCRLGTRRTGSFNGSNLADYTAEETTTRALRDGYAEVRPPLPSSAACAGSKTIGSRTNKRVIRPRPPPATSSRRSRSPAAPNTTLASGHPFPARAREKPDPARKLSTRAMAARA